MTREEAIEILRHWDDVVWRSQNHITMGDVSDALHFAEEALSNPWHKVSEELPKEEGVYLTYIPEVGIPYPMLWNGHSWEHELSDAIEYWMPIPDLPKED